MHTFITALTFSALLLAPHIAYAEPHTHSDHNHSHAEQADSTSPSVAGIEGAACEDTIAVKVNGLVCDFCARALEKVFGKRDEVSGISVDLDNGLVTIAMKPDQTIDDATLTQLITDSGYNVSAINKGC